MPNENAVTLDSLSAANKRNIQAIKRPILDAARSFGQVRERLTELAPRMVKAYNAIVADVERFAFVDFVRLIDPSVPTHAADRDNTPGYRNHRTYYTMQYMRRLVQQQRGARGQQGVRDSATDGFARTLATILQIVDDPGPVWEAIQREFDFTERLMSRLRRRVEATKPLFKLQTARPAKVGNVIHMERTTATVQGEAAEPMRQPGRSVTLPAEPARARKRAA